MLLLKKMYVPQTYALLFYLNPNRARDTQSHFHHLSYFKNRKIIYRIYYRIISICLVSAQSKIILRYVLFVIFVEL